MYLGPAQSIPLGYVEKNSFESLSPIFKSATYNMKKPSTKNQYYELNNFKKGNLYLFVSILSY